ncbi:MAG: PSD1 and planctomycete cytochrome C domain-containing protein [Akkermansiaceae bacterium]
MFKPVATFASIALVSSLDASEIKYGRDIRPILSDKCFFCHGTDPNTREGDLRLDIRDDALDAGAIVPGKPEKSELIERIFSTDPDEIMPTPKSHKTLNEQEKNLLTEWIKQGAEYEPHWAYSKPKRTQGASIDSLVATSLQSENLQLANPPKASVLLRRLHFDLIGLPPAPAQIAEFTKSYQVDPALAVREVIDRLLTSSHFGERMASSWLDLARFADTVGYHGDQLRSASPYRDYVIEAFNRDLPYDQFIIEQLAGDLLPNATLSQKVAASFSRLNQISAEGGIQNAEYLAKYQAERVRTTSSAFLGSTLACAECHDHKFDPFTAKDFYAMAAFFSDIFEKGAYTGNGRYQESEKKFQEQGVAFDRWGPVLKVPTEEQTGELGQLDQQMRKQEELLQKPIPNFEPQFQKWLASEQAKISSPDQKPVDLLLVEESMPSPPKLEGVQLVAKTKGPVHLGSHSRLQSSNNALIQHIVDLQAPYVFQDRDALYTWVHLDPNNLPKALMLQFHAADSSWNHRVYWGNQAIEYGRHANGTAAYHHAGQLPEAGKWVRLEIPAAAIGLKAGKKLTRTAYTQFGGRIHWDDAGVTTNSPLARLAHLPPAIAQLVTASKPSPRNFDTLRNHYRSIEPGLKKIRDQIAALKIERDNLNKTIPTVPATISAERRTIKILPRGDWTDKSGEVVTASPPEFLMNGQKIGNTRLDLAKWIASKENPLTARVFVNRIWASLFGTGLSNNLGDLGLQGEYPSHPELLDWLAIEFMENDWSVKHLLRTILTSRTYLQSSTSTGNLIDRDPHNRLLARQSQLRLPAEIVRDNALALAGLLDPSIGGPSVHPYQPKGYYRHLNFPRRTYTPSADQGQYRRGLYTHWQRSFLHPMMKNFDAPAREECATDRSKSNTPLQALTLLNDPSFNEAARHLATQLLKESSEDLAARAILHCLSRRPSEQELEILNQFLAKETQRFTENPELARQFISIGNSKPSTKFPAPQLAATTSLARAILNLHETITRY